VRTVVRAGPSGESQVKFYYTPYWDEELPVLSTTVIDIEGFRPDDFISSTVRLQKTFWEVELLEDIAIRGPRGGIYIDGGANAGNHAVFFGRFLADHVFAVEPNPLLLPVLRRNLERNGVKNVTVVPRALGDREGWGRMVSPPGGFEADTGMGEVEVVQQWSNASRPTEAIRVTTLDALAQEVRARLGNDSISFVKLDLEGMEVGALLGGRSLLQRYEPQLAVECNTAEALSAVKGFLEEFGYVHMGQFPLTPTHYFVKGSIGSPGRLTLSRGERYSRRLQMAEQDLDRVISAGETVILVDDDTFGERLAIDRTQLPFLERGGAYWGKPASDDHAIRELERMRDSGAGFIAFLWPTFWWLEFYTRLRDHLYSSGRVELENDRVVVFDLRRSPVSMEVS
jgi:FkbM family methyltransferase